MPTRLILPSLVLIAAAGSTVIGAQVPPSEAARAFTLDGLVPGPSPTPDTGPAVAPPPLAAPAIPESGAVTVPPVRAVFTLDTPIQDLIADPAAKAVLDRDLPGMSDDDNLAKFQMLGLRELQPQTGGQLTAAMLRKVAADLDALAGGTGAMLSPPKPTSSKRNQDTTR